MAAKNDVTGDSIKTKTGNPDAYAKGWDRIFQSKPRGNRKGGEVTIVAVGKNVGKSKLKKNN
jgi:pimeloyl-CoA synthetase